MDSTGTFKQRKVDLVKQGIDLGQVSDPIYFNSPVEGKFVPLDKALHDRICAGEFKL